jgi:hypothetical protein
VLAIAVRRFGRMSQSERNARARLARLAGASESAPRA